MKFSHFCQPSGLGKRLAARAYGSIYQAPVGSANGSGARVADVHRWSVTMKRHAAMKEGENLNFYLSTNISILKFRIFVLSKSRDRNTKRDSRSCESS